MMKTTKTQSWLIRKILITRNKRNIYDFLWQNVPSYKRRTTRRKPSSFSTLGPPPSPPLPSAPWALPLSMPSSPPPSSPPPCSLLFTVKFPLYEIRGSRKGRAGRPSLITRVLNRRHFSFGSCSS